MFQPLTIPLANNDGTPIDGTRGRKFNLRATGGVYFDSAPAGLTVMFDDDGNAIAVRAGRYFDRRFSSLTLSYPATATGVVALVTYEENELIRDMPQPSSLADSVMVSASLQFPTGGTVCHWLFVNPLPSVNVYELQSLDTVQGSVSAATSDDFALGPMSELLAAGLSGSNAVAQTRRYSDPRRNPIHPALDLWLAQPAALIPGIDGLVRGREAQANIYIPQNSVKGVKIPPGYYFAWLPNTGSSSALRARFTET